MTALTKTAQGADGALDSSPNRHDLSSEIPGLSLELNQRLRVLERLGRSRRKLAAGVIVVVLAVVSAVMIFEGPIAAIMYRARQHQRSVDYAKSRAAPSVGEAIAVLQIPKLDVNLVVAEGDTSAVLRGGPGHRPGTPLPGQVGNSIVSGHRQGWGSPFARLGELEVGDLIAVKLRTVTRVPIFKVESVQRVRGGDTRPFARSTGRRLTLVTGRGGWTSTDRLVVVASSGPTGKLATGKRTPARMPGESPIFNQWLALGMWALLAAGVAVWYLKGRANLLATGLIVAPLGLLGVFAIALGLDGLLPPLR